MRGEIRGSGKGKSIMRKEGARKGHAVEEQKQQAKVRVGWEV